MKPLNQLSIVLVLALILSCSVERTVVYQDRGGPVGNISVTGQVRAFLCELDEGSWNNVGHELWYTVATGKKATVKFIRLTGLTFAVQTDDSSAFELLLDSGAYTIVVECSHAYPDTFYNVYFAKDTTIDLKILYDYLDPSHVVFTFVYGSPGDTLHQIDELNTLKRLNALVGSMFAVHNAARNINSGYVYYSAPTNQPYEVWQAYEASWRVVENKAYSFPDHFSIVPLGYPCLS